MPGFQHSCWPLCNGGDGPAVDSTDHYERRSLEFLAAYYEINCRRAALDQARQNAADEREIKIHLEALATAVDAIDALEDRYAPIGFYGEPVMDGYAYRNITFVRPEMPKILPQDSMRSSHLAIPGLDEIPAEELRGSVVITRRLYGKVDI